MGRISLINKIENIVGFMREELEKNEGSTLQTISSSIKSGYENIKTGIQKNDRAQNFITDLKEQIEDLGDAIKIGDRKVSGKVLSTIEKRIQEFKAKYDVADDDETVQDAPKQEGTRDKTQETEKVEKTATVKKTAAPKKTGTAKSATSKTATKKVSPKSVASKKTAGTKAAPKTSKAPTRKTASDKTATGSNTSTK